MELISATEFGDFIKNETNGLFEFLEVPSEYHKYTSMLGGNLQCATYRRENWGRTNGGLNS